MNRVTPAKRRVIEQAAEGARLVRVSLDLTKFGTRTELGRRITAEWGEPDEWGIYTPTFTEHDSREGPVA